MLIIKGFWKTIAWSCLIIIIMLTPGNSIPSGKLLELAFFDKVIHAFLFMILQIFLLSEVHFKNKFHLKKIFIFTLPLVFFGFLTELMQMLIPERTANTIDFIFDVLGIFFGLFLYCVFKKSKN